MKKILFFMSLNIGEVVHSFNDSEITNSLDVIELSVEEKSEKVKVISLANKRNPNIACFYYKDFLWISTPEKIIAKKNKELVELPMQNGFLTYKMPLIFKNQNVFIAKNTKESGLDIVIAENFFTPKENFYTNDVLLEEVINVILPENIDVLKTKDELLIPNVYDAYSIVDPHSHQKLIICPTNVTASSISTKIRCPYFDVLETYQGIVIKPKNNLVDFSVGNDHVSIIHPQGMNFSCLHKYRIPDVKISFEDLNQYNDKQILKNDLQSQFNLALNFLAQGRGVEAINAIYNTELIHIYRENLNFRLMRGMSYLMSGNIPRAMKYLLSPDLGKERNLWLGAAIVKAGNKNGVYFMQDHIEHLSNYPDKIQSFLAIIGAGAAQEVENNHLLKEFLNYLKRNTLNIYQVNYLYDTLKQSKRNKYFTHAKEINTYKARNDNVHVLNIVHNTEELVKDGVVTSEQAIETLEELYKNVKNQAVSVPLIFTLSDLYLNQNKIKIPVDYYYELFRSNFFDDKKLIVVKIKDIVNTRLLTSDESIVTKYAIFLQCSKFTFDTERKKIGKYFFNELIKMNLPLDAWKLQENYSLSMTEEEIISLCKSMISNGEYNRGLHIINTHYNNYSYNAQKTLSYLKASIMLHLGHYEDFIKSSLVKYIDGEKDLNIELEWKQNSWPLLIDSIKKRIKSSYKVLLSQGVSDYAANYLDDLVIRLTISGIKTKNSDLIKEIQTNYINYVTSPKAKSLVIVLSYDIHKNFKDFFYVMKKAYALVRE